MRNEEEVGDKLQRNWFIAGPGLPSITILSSRRMRPRCTAPFAELPRITDNASGRNRAMRRSGCIRLYMSPCPSSVPHLAQLSDPHSPDIRRLGGNPIFVLNTNALLLLQLFPGLSISLVFMNISYCFGYKCNL
jgi:hypothetical protein